jgi:hypothetical protein
MGRSSCDSNDFLLPEAMLPRVATPGLKTAVTAAFAALSLANCVLIAEIDYGLIPQGAGGTSGTVPMCSKSADCNDDLPCTSDDCDTGLCTHTPLPEGTNCGSVTCVNSAVCNVTGECVTSPVVVDDGDACTTDSCDPASGAISNVPVDIDDKVACTTDACDPKTGTITHDPTTAGCLSWQPLPTNSAPDAREYHSAVWTGSKMIIWGGNGGPGKLVLNTGAAYDPTNHSWSPVSQTGAPSARHSHDAVWTGSKMIVWGGYDGTAEASGGGIYDPATDTWSAMTTVGEPARRLLFSALWNGKTMVIFGGLTNNTPISQGAAFDPATNTWTNLPTSGQPSPRFNHSALWIGDRIIIWGGQNYADWLSTGSSYNPTTNMWMGPTPAPNVPQARELHSAVWTGSEMLLWGGWDGGAYLNTGATFDPITSAWKPISATNAPSRRSEHSAVWTGKNFIVWGGCGLDFCGTAYGDGGAFTPNPNGGTWEPIAEVAVMPARRRHTTVWTGSSMIVWGGRNANGLLGTGAETLLKN